jgi:hypothetical protein
MKTWTVALGSRGEIVASYRVEAVSYSVDDVMLTFYDEAGETVAMFPWDGVFGAIVESTEESLQSGVLLCHACGLVVWPAADDGPDYFFDTDHNYFHPACRPSRKATV